MISKKIGFGFGFEQIGKSGKTGKTGITNKIGKQTNRMQDNSVMRLLKSISKSGKEQKWDYLKGIKTVDERI